MNIIIKYIIKSSMEKKSRTILIILAIAVSGALFYASLAVKDTLEDAYIQSFTQTIGKADILINANEKSPSQYISDKLVNRIEPKTEYIVRRIDMPLNYRVNINNYQVINVVGINLSDYKKNNNIELLESSNIEPFTDNKIIISQYTAEHYGLKLDDNMQFMINDRLRNFKIVGIAAKTGVFLNESQGKFAIVPYNKLSKCLDTKEYPTGIYIKLKDKLELADVMYELKSLYPKYEVKEPFTQQDLDDKTATLSLALLLISGGVSIMSVFIIYSSFKVIMLQKMPYLGTFRSVGASKKQINYVMFLESSIYGILGGISACIIGILISYILAKVTMPVELKAIHAKVNLNISIIKLIITFLISVTICFISTIIPILQISNKSVKEIVLNIKPQKGKRNKKIYIIGVISLIISAVAPYVLINEYALVGVIVTIPAILIALGILLPVLVNILTRVLEPLVHLIFGNIGDIAIRNVRRDKSIFNSITLVMIGVSVLLMVNSLTTNLTQELILAIADIETFDMDITFKNIEHVDLNNIKSNDEVKDVLGIHQVADLEAPSINKTITLVDGVGSAKYLEFKNINILGNREELIKKLQEGRNIIITKTLQRRNHLNIGDSIELDFSPYKGEKREYTIIGVADTCMCAGSFAMVGMKYLQMDTKYYYYSAAYMHLNDNVDLEYFKNKLQKTFKSDNPTIESCTEFKDNFKKSMQQVTSLVSGFAIVAIVMGCIGIINNFVISFIERKHSLAVLKSIGMSKKQVKKMLLVEALLIGGIGGVIGILGGVLSFNTSPLFMTLGDVDMAMHNLPDTYVYYVVVSVVITIISCITPTYSSAKLDIVQEIKCE